MVVTASRTNDSVSVKPEAFDQLASRRRRRPGWIAAGAGLVAISMLAGAFLYTLASTTEPMLAVRSDLPAGHIMTDADLIVVDITPDPSANLVPASEKQRVLNKATRGPLPQGQLISEGLFEDSSLVLEPGKVVVAAPMKVGDVTNRADKGSLVRMYSIADGDQTDAALLGEARIWALFVESGSREFLVSLIVDEGVEAAVVQAAAAGDLRLTLLSGS